MPKVKMEGADELRRALRKAGKIAPIALASAMVVEQEKVMAVAKTRTPVDLGPLRASGTVLPPEIAGTRITVASGFGGAAKDYALVQHEDLTLNHSVGGPKFLEGPFNERIRLMPRMLAKGVESALKRLGK